MTTTITIKTTNPVESATAKARVPRNYALALPNDEVEHLVPATRDEKLGVIGDRPALCGARPTAMWTVRFGPGPAKSCAACHDLKLAAKSH